jgi:PTS system glucose-specific IIA component
VVPVVVMDEREPSNISVSDAVTAATEIASGAVLFSASK